MDRRRRWSPTRTSRRYHSKRRKETEVYGVSTVPNPEKRKNHYVGETPE